MDMEVIENVTVYTNALLDQRYNWKFIKYAGLLVGFQRLGTPEETFHAASLRYNTPSQNQTHKPQNRESEDGEQK